MKCRLCKFWCLRRSGSIIFKNKVVTVEEGNLYYRGKELVPRIGYCDHSKVKVDVCPKSGEVSIMSYNEEYESKIITAEDFGCINFEMK